MKATADHGRWWRTLPAQGSDRGFGALPLLGKRWSGIVVGTLLSGPSRFTEISRQVSGVSERMLSERLNELTTAGLIERRVLAGPPVGVEYRLTPRGEAGRPALDQLGLWATEHLRAT